MTSINDSNFIISHKAPTPQGDITLLNLYAPNNIVSKYIKQSSSSYIDLFFHCGSEFFFF